MTLLRAIKREPVALSVQRKIAKTQSLDPRHPSVRVYCAEINPDDRYFPLVGAVEAGAFFNSSSTSTSLQPLDVEIWT
jgi:hypothetical protein